MIKTDAQKAEDERLALVIADRLHHAIEAFPQHFRSGRGRTEDFSVQYEVSRGLAKRVLEGRSVPPVRLLKRIADDLGIPADWLLGRTDDPIEGIKESPVVRVDLWSHATQYDPTPGAISLPRKALPPGLALRHLLVVICPDHGCQPYAGPGDLLLVQQRSDVMVGAQHLVAWRNGRLDSARITVYEASDRVELATLSGRTETVSGDHVVFGVGSVAASGKSAEVEDGEDDNDDRDGTPAAAVEEPLLRVVGLIVGRIGFNVNGIQMSAAASQ